MLSDLLMRLFTGADAVSALSGEGARNRTQFQAGKKLLAIQHLSGPVVSGLPDLFNERKFENESEGAAERESGGAVLDLKLSVLYVRIEGLPGEAHPPCEFQEDAESVVLEGCLYEHSDQSILGARMGRA